MSCSSLQYVRDSFVIQGKSIAVEVQITIVSQSLVMLDKYLKACKPYVPRHLRPLQKALWEMLGKHTHLGLVAHITVFYLRNCVINVSS